MMLRRRGDNVQEINKLREEVRRKNEELTALAHKQAACLESFIKQYLFFFK